MLTVETKKRARFRMHSQHWGHMSHFPTLILSLSPAISVSCSRSQPHPCILSVSMPAIHTHAHTHTHTHTQEVTRNNMDEKDFFNAHLDSQVPYFVQELCWLGISFLCWLGRSFFSFSSCTATAPSNSFCVYIRIYPSLYVSIHLCMCICPAVLLHFHPFIYP